MTSLQSQILALLLLQEGEGIHLNQLAETLNTPIMDVKQAIYQLQEKYPICTHQGQVYIPKRNWIGILVSAFLLAAPLLAVIYTWQ
ncbi:hypothetical protein [Fictibacillus gelatini]|uniref:hypothetical protein n=1 Tax=Fictibacillus gelatini TaxID=225985 RepID=UPI0005574787|nr:hypothetical protein [Fictibacillus gelatini]